MMGNPSRLRINEISLHGGSRQGIRPTPGGDGVSIHVSPGEIVGLLGPNGAGKTTTFNMVVGIVRPDEGVCFRAGRDHGFAHARTGRAGIGYLTGAFGVSQADGEGEYPRDSRDCDIGTAERQLRLKSLLDELDLSSLSESKAYQLSGGEKRGWRLPVLW